MECVGIKPSNILFTDLKDVER